MVTKHERLRAGHAEIQGETIAKFELFEQGFNPYSRYLDIDKVDLILRRRDGNSISYREVQVKYGRLYLVGPKWERELFDVTSWRFFKPDDFKNCPKHLFIVYVLALPSPDAYKGDLFIFPVHDFHEIINDAIKVNSKKGPTRKVYFSRALHDKKWYLRTKSKFNKDDFSESTISIDKYRRNFNLLR